MPTAAASGSASTPSSAGPSSSSISVNTWCSSRSSVTLNVTEKPPWRAFRKLATTPTPLLVVLHGGPQAVAVHRLDVALHLLARAVGHDGLALLVDVEHQLVRLLLGVAEVLLEDECDVAHQVHRVVPDDGHPRLVGDDDLVGVGLLDLHRRHGHAAQS